MVKKQTIAVITTGRQDWGILHSVVRKLTQLDYFDIAVIPGGMACTDEYGNLSEIIKKEGFPVYDECRWDLQSSICSQSAQVVMMAEIVFARLMPDAVLLLGDRFETFAFAQAATLLKIPLIHLHGGEETEGAIDNQLRHAITKLSHVHFVSCEKHRQRVVQMGENSDYVFNVGAPGLDNMHSKELPSIAKVLAGLKLKKDKNQPLFLITYHPPTLIGNAENEVNAMLDALSDFDSINIFTAPNNDPGSEKVHAMISEFVNKKTDKNVCVQALGEKRYWSVLKSADVVLGNSSSGIIEAPAVPAPVVNIGKRQTGRGTAPCIINVPKPNKNNIRIAIERCLSPDFLSTLSCQDSLYGDGYSSDKISQTLKKIDLSSIKKRFQQIDKGK